MARTTRRSEELERVRWRYGPRGQVGKGRLRDEFCEPHGYERKYAIKRLGPAPAGQSPRPRPGPEPRYEPVQEVVERI